MRWLALLLVGLGGWLFGACQTLTRADLAPRLIELESCWEQHRHSETARLRACPPLTEGISAFFTNRYDTLARKLTEACWYLQSSQPLSPSMSQAGSVGVRVAPAVEHATLTQRKALPVQIFRYYEPADKATDLWLKWRIESQEGRVHGEGTVPLTATELPLENALSPGDYQIHLEVGDSQSLRRWVVPIAVIADATQRLAQLEEALSRYPNAPATERATVRMTVSVVRGALQGVAPETLYPLAQLLARAERWVQQWSQGKGGWRAEPGDYWLCAETGTGEVYFRLFIPKGYSAKDAVPLIVALHGAGGNEHLFFEGYGLGRVLAEAQQRGWAVLAPRSSVNLRHLWGALEKVRELIAIDSERIFLMGHSMGGAQAFQAVREKPDMFRAVALFASAGQPSQFPKTLPLFMAVGEQEIGFLKTNIERAYQTLKAQDLAHLELKRYNGCEHLMIVREALPDACAFLERFAPRSP